MAFPPKRTIYPLSLFRSIGDGLKGRILPFLFLASSLLIGNALAGQEPIEKPEADLRGLDRVRVTISQTTPDATVCGIHLSDFLPLVESDLQAGGLALSSSPATLVTLSLMTTHYDSQNICGTATTLGAYRMVSFFDETVGWLRTGYVVLWQRGRQVMSSPADHSATTAAAVKRLTATFLETWRKENFETSSQ